MKLYLRVGVFHYVQSSPRYLSMNTGPVLFPRKVSGEIQDSFVRIQCL